MMAPWERSSCWPSTGIDGTRSSPSCSDWIGRWSVSIRSCGDARGAWRLRSSGSSFSSPEPCPRGCPSRPPTGPSGSRTSSSIRPRRDRRSAFAPPRTTGVRSRRYREVAAGGAEPTRESCRGRHAQAPGPREVRRSEHDADETPDTCSSRSPASGIVTTSRGRPSVRTRSLPPRRGSRAIPRASGPTDLTPGARTPRQDGCRPPAAHPGG